MVNGIDHFLTGTEVLCQSPNGFSSMAGIQISLQVGPAKTVNGLLGIANHQEGTGWLLIW